MIFIETSRLILREWTTNDLKALQEMNCDSLVMEFFLKKLSSDESIGLYNKFTSELKEKGYGIYAVELKESRGFIGFTGFHHTDIGTDFCPCVEIAWRYLPKAWGHGYATEAASACIEYAKKNLPLTEVYAFTTLLNKRSENVMKKIGMRKISNFGHPLVPDDHKLKEHVLYKLEL